MLDGGASYHHEAIHGERFRDRFDRVIYAPDLGDADLDGIAALIVADRIHASVLQRKRRVLLAFLDRGGTLIVLGENRAHEWLPAVSWSFRPTNFWWWLAKGADPGHRIVAPEHEIFRHVKSADVVWHYHMWTSGNRGRKRKLSIVPRSGRCRPVVRTIGGFDAALCRAGCVAEDYGALRRR